MAGKKIRILLHFCLVRLILFNDNYYTLILSEKRRKLTRVLTHDSDLQHSLSSLSLSHCREYYGYARWVTRFYVELRGN